MPFEIGRVYKRREELHATYRGQEQGGISTPVAHPFLMLFTGDNGEQYGYRDGWDKEGVFVFTGEGQIGDMTFSKGNLAIRDHAPRGKVLELFEALGKGQGVRYVGQFVCSSWDYRRGPDRNGHDRQVIVFHLVPIADAHATDEVQFDDFDDLKKRAYEAASEAVESKENLAKRTVYERAAAVRTYVLARANGKCESCEKPAPFKKPDGMPYLEPHHTRRVSDGGPDHPRWVGAVCPNCHREMHSGANSVAINERLQAYLGTVEKA